MPSFTPVPVFILIIDDETDICQLLGTVLERARYRVYFANSLAEARQLLGRHNFHIIFLDNNLPDGKGIDFISCLKEAFPDTKIIFMTTFKDITAQKISGERGADYFLPKPFYTRSVYSALEGVLNGADHK